MEAIEDISSQKSPEQVVEMREENNFDLSFHELPAQDMKDKELYVKIIDCKKKKSQTLKFNEGDEQSIPDLKLDVPNFDDVGLPEASLVQSRKETNSLEYAVPDRPKPKIISNVRKLSPVRIIRGSVDCVRKLDESSMAGVSEHENIGALEFSEEETMRHSR